MNEDGNGWKIDGKREEEWERRKGRTEEEGGRERKSIVLEGYREGRERKKRTEEEYSIRYNENSIIIVI